MPPMTLGSRDLLEYDARYGVLICRECQYAIQKSALRSHLLRHRIYRDERKRLLSSIAQLELLEPHDVPLPGPASSPIDALPIISGYRCTVAGCESLCASLKRMRRHQSEIHSLREPSEPSVFARQVKLQTFFRGTKLRYFEVNRSPAAGSGGTPKPNAASKYQEKKGHYERVHDAETAMPLSQSPPREALALPKGPPSLPTVDFDLETLRYFHHFTTTTSLTLPGTGHLRDVTSYWQTDVVRLALGRGWLICGLLALSASHLATFEDDTKAKRVHHERSARFLEELSVGLEETAKRDLDAVAVSADEKSKKAGTQIRSMLFCAHWASADSTLDQGIVPNSPALSQLQYIMTTVRSFVGPDCAFQPGSVQTGEDRRHQQAFAQASRVLGIWSSAVVQDKTLPALLKRLSMLPSDMTEVLGRPEDPQDALATLSAIAALIECSETSFMSQNVGAAWQGMTTWVTMVPDHFTRMISRDSPAALVVLAQWAALLVRRAEDCGCWWLKGVAKRILVLIGEHTAAANCAEQSPLGGLME